MNQSPLPQPHIRTVLFDLDGTLLDTAPDLADALNRVLQEQGQQPLPLEVIRPHASHGTLALIRLGFQLSPDDPGFEPLRQRLLEIYRDNIANKTRLFSGTDTLLHEIERLGLNWGVVTNKPAFLTEPLLQQLALTPRTACIVSGDTTPNRKPDPEPMLHACHLAGSKAEQCLYVGDAQRDIEAGKNAGMLTLVALYGYIGEHDNPETWGADSMIHHPGEILNWLT
jgi:phosphoglycolate phosphatase